MGDLTLTAVDDALLRRLANLAEANRLSLEDQAKAMLQSAVGSDRIALRVAKADRIAAMTPKGVVQSDSTELLREDRSR